MPNKALREKFGGVVEILISGFWVYHNVETFYNYQMYPEILRYMMIPYWVLVMNCLTGVVGIWFGIQLLQLKQSVIKSYLIPIFMFVTVQFVFYWL
mgnify:CR=1 FL=1